jgi:hypothetical protein
MSYKNTTASPATDIPQLALAFNPLADLILLIEGPAFEELVADMRTGCASPWCCMRARSSQEDS